MDFSDYTNHSLKLYIFLLLQSCTTEQICTCRSLQDLNLTESIDSFLFETAQLRQFCCYFWVQHRKGRVGWPLHSVLSFPPLICILRHVPEQEVKFLLLLYSQRSGLWFNSSYSSIFSTAHIFLSPMRYFLVCVCVCVGERPWGWVCGSLFFFFLSRRLWWEVSGRRFSKNGANPWRRVWAVRACPQIRGERERARQPDQSTEHRRRRRNEGGDKLE